MTHTVIGLFDDRDDARGAMEELIRKGFVKENVDLSNRRVSAAETGKNRTDTGDNAGIGDRISNFFSSLFSDDETTARNYTHAAEDAEAILTVHADSDERAELAQEILDDNGAVDVNEHDASYRTNAVSSERSTNENTDVGSKKTIPVVQEKLDVGKQEVERGGARIRSRIVEKPVEESVRLREEHVTVNRRPVDREVTKGDLEHFQPGEMEITERAEVPIVGKTARVVEEVEVGKEVTERQETVKDTVRGTQVDVEDMDREANTAAKAKRAQK
jgi:stress response protein YsnF